jgi:hypothetical protein
MVSAAAPEATRRPFPEPVSEYEFLLVARHGRIDDLGPVRKVASRLRDTLTELQSSPTPLKVTAVEDAGTPETRATADVFAEALGLIARPAKVKLSIDRFPPFHPAEAQENLAQARADIPVAGDSAAVLLVGHEPAIDWLLAGWVDRPVALATGEVACLARRPRDEKWHLWWVLTPPGAAEIEALRAKISSKMTVLSLFAGFTLAATAAVLSDLEEKTVPRALGGSASACLALAAATYVCVLLAYDELMMPPRFWHAAAPSQTTPGPLDHDVLARPPSSAGLILYERMTALWGWVIGALWLSGAAVALLALSKVWENGPGARGVVIAVADGVALAIGWWWRKHRPRLGTED